MFTNFNAAERAVHYPADRRLVARFQPGALAVCAALVLVPPPLVACSVTVYVPAVV